MTDATNSHSRRMYNAQKKTRAALAAIEEGQTND
jgi:hypothetical protein